MLLCQEYFKLVRFIQILLPYVEAFFELSKEVHFISSVQKDPQLVGSSPFSEELSFPILLYVSGEVGYHIFLDGFMLAIPSPESDDSSQSIFH